MKVRALFAFLIIVGGCGIFETRTPELPATGNNFIWTPASSVSDLVVNFQGSLEMQDGSNHQRVFIQSTDSIAGSPNQSYRFTPRAGLDQASLATFATWDRTSEGEYLNKLRAALPKDARLKLILSNVEVENRDASSSTYKAEYSLLIPADAGSPIPSAVSGILMFDLRLIRTLEGTSEWRIVTWTDLQLGSSGGATWSDLKAKLIL